MEQDGEPFGKGDLDPGILRGQKRAAEAELEQQGGERVMADAPSGAAASTGSAPPPDQPETGREGGEAEPVLEHTQEDLLLSSLMRTKALKAKEEEEAAKANEAKPKD